MEDRNTEISRHSISKDCRGNYILSNETSQQLDPHYIAPESFLTAANTQTLYQAHLRAQMDPTGQHGMVFPSLTNQGTAHSHPPSVHAPVASSPPTPPQPFAPQENQNNASQLFPNAQIQISQSRGPEKSSLPKNNSAERICSRQQNNFVTRAPNATLPSFPTTKKSSPRKKCSLAPKRPADFKHSTEQLRTRSS